MGAEDPLISSPGSIPGPWLCVKGGEMIEEDVVWMLPSKTRGRENHGSYAESVQRLSILARRGCREHLTLSQAR